MKRRQDGSLLLKVGIVIVFLTAISVKPSEVYGQQPITVTIGTARDPNLASEILVADAKGMFERYGLRAEVTLFPSGADLVTAAAAGDIQFASAGDVPSISLRASGADTIVIAQMSDISGAQYLLARPELGFDPQKLRRARVGVLQSTVGVLFIERFMESLGVDSSELTMYNLAPADALAAYLRGDVDVIHVWQPMALQGQRAGALVLAQANHSYAPGREGERLIRLYAVLFTQRSFAQAQPQVVENVLRALAEAVDFIRNHPDEAADIVARELNLDPADNKVFMGDNVYQMVIDDEFAAGLQGNIDFLASVRDFRVKPDVNTWIAPEFLKRVRPEWVTWEPVR